MGLAPGTRIGPYEILSIVATAAPNIKDKESSGRERRALVPSRGRNWERVEQKAHDGDIGHSRLVILLEAPRENRSHIRGDTSSACIASPEHSDRT